MLIPQNLALEHSENHSTGYFIDTMLGPSSLAVSAPSSAHNNISGTIQGVYPPSDSYFTPGRVQSELSGMNIYPAQPGSSTISSPGSYAPVPGNVGAAPGLMGGHYGTGLEHSPYYAPLGDGYEIKSSVGEIWPGAYGQAPPSYYPYDSTFGAQYPYDRYCGMEINDGVRRKNATRESTNTLKNWLLEHKKNPYPTKGEKIMLAIITKMTLTQVSTWFANARRRLKKENKMTWVPKNRSNDANSAGGKKVEDDDDSASQHSQEDKSDLDASVDSDDSDTRKVTSTNSNDATITQNRVDGSDYQGNKAVQISDGIQEDVKLSSLPHAEHEQSSFSSFDKNNKPLWSPGNDERVQQTDETVANQAKAVRPSFHSEDEYNASSMNIKPQPSMLSPSLMMGHVDNTRLPSNCKFSPHWSTTGYQDVAANNAVSSSRVQVERSSTDMDSLRHRSPRMTDAKPFASNPMFPINRPQETISEATSSIMTSSYLHGFPNQTQPIGNYRSSDQLPLPQSSGMNPAYYSQQDMSLRSDVHNPERIPSSYPASRDDLQSKMGPTSIVPVASPNSPDEKQLFHQQVHHINSSGAYYPAGHLCKPATSASVETSFSSPFYQQETYNQLPPHLQATNTDYYPRKNDQMSGYSGSDGSPFPLQASASPRK